MAASGAPRSRCSKRSSVLTHPRSITFLPPGALSRLFLLGLSPVMETAARWAASHGIAVNVLMGPRQADAAGHALADRLRSNGATVGVCEFLEEAPAGPCILPPDNAVIVSFGSPWIIRRPLIARFEGRQRAMATSRNRREPRRTNPRQ